MFCTTYRNQGTGGPVKRLVQPKLVHPVTKPPAQPAPMAEQQTVTDAAKTAAVAAASAVAATEPFLRVSE